MISKEVADKTYIILPLDEYIIKCINMINPKPIILSNDIYQMWIDKYYIAYSELLSDKVKYVYLSKQHIKEEYEAYKEAAKERKKQIEIPFGIKEIFDEALLKMKKSGENYIVMKM